MNEAHLKLCSSAEWGEGIRTHLMSWVAEQPGLGDDVLEIGPGPGLTTDELRLRAAKVTAVEADESLATQLRGRLDGTNVTVVHADATDMPFEAGTFSGAGSFFMFHHVPDVQLQDRLFAEVARVLQPDGVFLAVDSLDSPGFRDLHTGDICVPLDPETVRARLEHAGFTAIDLTVDHNIRWAARAPGQVAANSAADTAEEERACHVR